jgi:glutaredoxin
MSLLARLRGPMWLVSLLLLLGTFYIEHERAGQDRAAAAVPPATPVTPARGARGARPLRVLFVGNSLTSSHDVPRLVARLADAAGEPRPFEFHAETPGGFGLKEHLAGNRLQPLLADARWDAVVLQDQSQRPSWPESREAWFFAPARQLDALIRRAGSKTVFYETYARREGDDARHDSDPYAAMQQRISEGYRQIARELNAEIVPVGTLWARCVRERPALRLWQKDGVHPSLAGAYLTASAFYAHLYRRSPVGNPFAADLDGADASALQELAASLLRDPLEVAAATAQVEAAVAPDPAADTGTAPPTPEPAAPAAARLATVDTAQDLARRARINADIEQRSLQAGRSRVSVTMYKTSWCGACKTASAYLREHDIPYQERDLDTDPGARDDVRRLNPRGSVPTIDVDGEVLVGWSPRSFETALDRAARAHAQNL